MPNIITSMSLSKDLITSISSDSLDMLSEYAEIAIDSTMESGLIQDIPILGSLVRLTKIGSTIKDYLFANKLKYFLLSTNSVSTEERIKFLDKYYSKEEKSEVLGEKLINLLDKIDSNKKATMAGKVFNLFLLEEISYIEFSDLLYAIENFKLHYQDDFVDTYLSINMNYTCREEVLEHFFICGLTFSNNERKMRMNSGNALEPKFSKEGLTGIGKLFLLKVLDIELDKRVKEFKQTILDFQPRKPLDNSKWRFIRTITRAQFEKYIEKETIYTIFDFSFHRNIIWVGGKNRYGGILPNDNNTYSLYKRISN